MPRFAPSDNPLHPATRSSFETLRWLSVVAIAALGCGLDGSDPDVVGGETDGRDAEVGQTQTPVDGGPAMTSGSGGSGGHGATEAGTDCGFEPDVGTPGGAGHIYYLAVDGDDTNPGTQANPFGTFEHAIARAEPGDTILVRGGTYLRTTTVTIDKSATVAMPINLWAYPGETPVLDFSASPRHDDPPQPRDDDSLAATADAVGVLVAGGTDGWHLKGLTIRNAPYYGVRVYGSSNVFEQLVLHDNKAAGLELTGKEGWSPSDNLVLNTDSFHNFDPQSNGEDADGFGAKFDGLGSGNVFRGNRAWSNSDDGYDFWHASAVVVEDCWAFDNGFNRTEWVPFLNGSYQGDGIGFKLGQDAAELTLNRVAAWGNKAFGIDENGNGSVGGVTINNATLVNNTKNGNPVQIELDDGRPHTVTNTIAFDVDGSGVTHFDAAVDDAFNTWNGGSVSPADFESLDMQALFAVGSGPRKPDGSLPDIGLRLVPTSGLIDAGVDVGLPFQGSAPDQGAFESTP